MHAFETNMSLTGSNADYRTMVKPSEHGKVATALLQAITGQGGTNSLPESVQAAVINAAKDLKKAGSKGLVLAGSNELDVQRVVNAINNAALGAVWDPPCSLIDENGLVPRAPRRHSSSCRQDMQNAR